MKWLTRAALLTLFVALALTGTLTRSRGPAVVRLDGPTGTEVSALPGPKVRMQGTARNYQGVAYGQRGYAPTADGSQTKLWFAGRTWWTVLPLSKATGTEILRLNAGTGAWVRTGITVDTRARSYADVVWTGRQLFVACRVSNGELRLFRYSPGPMSKPWILDPGFPTVIARGGASSLSVSLDSAGRVWAAFNQGNRIFVTSSPGGLQPWTAPQPLTARNAVAPSDTAATAAWNDSIVVVWSDQVTGSFWRAEHADRRNDLAMVTSRRPILSGHSFNDGYVRLLAAPDGRRLYAVVKTSRGDVLTQPPQLPLIMVLHRERGSNEWQGAVAATTRDQMTRPQLMINEDSSRLYLVATHDQSGGSLFLKVANTSTMAFPAGKGTRLLAWPGATVNNPAVGRQPLSKSSGMLVVSSDAKQGVYYYSHFPLR